MRRKDKDDAFDSDGPGHSGMENPHNNRWSAERVKTTPRRKSVVMDDEATLQSREKRVLSREDAARAREKTLDLREDAVHLRETAAQVREGNARALEAEIALRKQQIDASAIKQAESVDYTLMLQQANTRLVTASIEAQMLVEQVQSAKVQLDHVAHHDALTDLPNRILLQDRLSQAIELARRQERQLALMYLDLDQFKHINDSLGHAVGDQLLMSVAQRLVGSMRHSDTVSRQGGDEFVLLLPYIQHVEDVLLSAQKIIAAMAQPFHLDQHSLHINVSIGICIYPNDGQDAESLMKNADIAMYSAKENGRNNYKFFEPSMNIRAVQRQATEVGLRLALERNEFVLYYQPKVDLRSGMIVGAEALIRWQHPERGLLPPAQFISVAEDCGLILPLGRWVLRTACRQARAWVEAGSPSITVAVNTSALEFRAKDFLENICKTIKDTRMEPRCLELELTENLLMHNAESTNTMLHALAELGVKLAVDDFGSGYSSLSYLRQFPINTLKIDQSFVNQVTSNPDDAAITLAVISLGRSLKQRVIAEGVETAEQYTFLLAQQCDEGQGRYFGQPMLAEEFSELLARGIAPSLLNPV